MATKIIFLFFLISIFSSFVISAELTINAPSEIKLNEEFSVSIDADSSDKFDVKIFVHFSSDGNIDRGEYISEIFNILTQKWQSSWFYIKASFPETKSYNLRVVKSPGERNICLRLKKTGTKNLYLKCQPIKVLAGPEDNSKNEKKDEENQQSQKEKGVENEDKNKSEQDSSNKGEPKLQGLSNSQQKTEQKQEKIILNSPQTEIKKVDVVITKEEKIRNLIIYSFLAFTVLLLVLIGLRKL